MKSQKNKYENEEDSSKNNIEIISLIPKGMDNEESSKINLNVFLSLVYQQVSLKFLVQVSVVKNEKTKEVKFNMGEIIEQIFSKFDKNIISEFILSYFINEGNEKIEEDNKIYNYLGEINKDKNSYQNLLLNVPEDKEIYFKLRQKLRREKLLNPEYFQENEAKYSNCSKEKNLNEEENNKKSGGRGKEKSIEYVILKVWMLNYLKNKYKYLTLRIISDLIGCPKKTLDHYEKALLNANEKGFNFNKTSKSKINVLLEKKRERED